MFSKIRVIVVFFCLCILSGAAFIANAQPPEDPAAPILAPIYGPPITLAQAKLMAVAVNEAAGRNREQAMVIAITDPTGELVYFEKMDGAAYMWIQLTQRKAVMAARYRFASGTLPSTGAVGMPDAVSLEGGLPIVYQGQTIGAIGISGSEFGDVAYAELAIDVLNRR